MPKKLAKHQQDIINYIDGRARWRTGKMDDRELTRLRQLAIEAYAAGATALPFPDKTCEHEAAIDLLRMLAKEGPPKAIRRGTD